MSNWFPFGKNGNEEGWRFDIVSLLAVIGENSIEAHSQALTSSWTCMLPRLIPAPQVLLKPARPNRMRHVDAKVVGVHNGVIVDSLNYFPNIIHPIDDLKPLSFNVLEIKHKLQQTDPNTFTPMTTATTSSMDLGQLEHGGRGPVIRRTETFTDKVKSKVKDKLHSDPFAKKPLVPPKKTSPLILLNWFSFVVTVALFVSAAVTNDGTACVAIGTMALVSSIVGFASFWKATLTQRKSSSKVPPGDVVIRTREGAFLLVVCDEKVARELYFGTEECEYKIGTQAYRGLVGAGTMLLMVAVVLLGNCNFDMQAAIASSYILLNAMFWGVSLIPKNFFWDLSAYEWKFITKDDSKDAEVMQDDGDDDSDEKKPSFTRTMWYAIRETGKTSWITKSGAAPFTKEWEQWLREAEEEAQKAHRDWPAVQRNKELVGGNQVTSNVQLDKTDNAIQRAPAVEIPAPEMQETKGI